MVQEENLSRNFEGILRIRKTGNWSLEATGSENMNITCTIDWSKVYGEDGPIIWTTA